MELPSTTYRLGVKDRSKSFVEKNNKDWYIKYYIKRSDPVKEIWRGKQVPMLKFMTFQYDPKYATKLDFYDNVPISLTMGHTNGADGIDNIIAINFSFIPRNIRMKILDEIVIAYSAIIDRNRKIISKRPGKHSQLIHTQFDYTIAEKILDKSGFKFAIRSYIYKRTETRPLIISYDDWWRIGTFESDFIRKLNISAIHKRYMSKK